MRVLVSFDIPKSKSGKTLRMRLLRLFEKENIRKLQDSVWDITNKTHVIKIISNNFIEFKSFIKRETKSVPKFFVIKGDVTEIE